MPVQEGTSDEHNSFFANTKSWETDIYFDGASDLQKLPSPWCL